MPANAVRETAEAAGDDLFDRIGDFLSLQGLSVEPSHYAFAYQVLADPTGPIADAVAQLTEGGVRLDRDSIEGLGGVVSNGAPFDPSGRRRSRRAGDVADVAAFAEKLACETRDQVAEFARVVETIHDETLDFGCELAASADAITRAPQIAGIDEIARITGAMLGRVHSAEAQLAKATEEAVKLRINLDEARTSARRDPLTGLPNRRAFEERFAAHDWTSGPLFLALCDVDRFKRINDGFGHAVGDRVLTAIGQSLEADLAGQFVARHGGEEFAMLLTGTDIAAVTAILDGARRTIAAKRFRARETAEPLGQITLSAGVTAVSQGESIDPVFDRADRLLYAAKAAGRDRVEHD